MKQRNMNSINDLLELGLIHPKNDREILLHPMVREVAVEELKPSVGNCAILLDSLQEISLMHGLEFMDNRQVFQTVESIITTINKDDRSKYLLFLENVFQYMDKYRNESGMQTVVDELTTMLSDASVGTAADRACLLDCRAALEKDTEKKIKLQQEAIQALGDVHPGKAHLAANLHSNLGALYHEIGYTDLAKEHMEQGICFMEEYGLTGYHDSVLQICNYAVVLTDMGEPQRAYAALQKLSQKVQKLNSDQCLDYGLVQQTMGSVSFVQGDHAQSQLHFQKAMEIFEQVFQEEPELLEQKRQELMQTAFLTKQKLLL